MYLRQEFSGRLVTLFQTRSVRIAPLRRQDLMGSLHQDLYDVPKFRSYACMMKFANGQR